MSLLLTFYFLFLLTYGGILGFAVYRVFLFAKNKDLKGYSRRITLVFVVISLFLILISLIVVQRYEWNDTFSNIWTQIFGSDIKGGFINLGSQGEASLPVGK